MYLSLRTPVPISLGQALALQADEVAAKPLQGPAILAQLEVLDLVEPPPELRRSLQDATACEGCAQQAADVGDACLVEYMSPNLAAIHCVLARSSPNQLRKPPSRKPHAKAVLRRCY